MAGVFEAIIIEDAAVNTALTRVAEAGGNTEQLMDEIASAMLFSVQRRFETESDPEGNPWQRLAPRTAKARANRKTRGNGPVTPKILRDSNRLYSSITSEASETEAVVGTNVAYAGIHQDGGVITQYAQSRKVKFRKVGGRTQFAKKAHKRATEKPVTYGERTIVIPARPYLGFSDADRAEILAIAERFYGSVIEGEQP